jgi:glycosyltransferase involved in cell wall biosynthesis
MNNSLYIFLIPASNPDQKLIEIVNALKKYAYQIIIIDDGSRLETLHIFQELKDNVNNENIVFLKHAINLGKGAALKTAFNYILVNFPNVKGVVTLDSDGQHPVASCLHVLEALKKGRAFVLGYRSFSKNIPWKSYLGNNISKFIYKMALGRSFKDTQTGLRGLNKSFMLQCLTIKSNHFEFETEQLALAINHHIDIDEVPIETIYIEKNKASSFRPLVDSFKIYFVLFRYGLSSIITGLTDFIVFMIALYFGVSVFHANMLARTASIGIQFNLLDKFVFYTKTKLRNFVLFASYVYIMGIISTWAQISAKDHLHISIISSKIIIETTLFFANFAVLRLYIFTREK